MASFTESRQVGNVVSPLRIPVNGIDVVSTKVALGATDHAPESVLPMDLRSYLLCPLANQRPLRGDTTLPKAGLRPSGLWFTGSTLELGIAIGLACVPRSTAGPLQDE